MKQFRLINRTWYYGWDLRVIIRRGLLHYSASPGHYQVCVKYDGDEGHPHCGSYAILGEAKIVMSVAADVVDIPLFARELMHEIEHTMGLEHKDMPDIETLDSSWSDGLDIRNVNEYRNGRDD